MTPGPKLSRTTESTAMIAGVALFAAACWWPGGRTASAQALPFEPGTDVAFEQKLGAAIPADLAFRNEDGQPVTLGAFLSERPVALMLVQYRCPMLCNVALDGAVRSLKAVSLDPGRDFRVLVVSFDPREGPRLARQKRDSVLERYDRPRTDGGWHFLTGEKDAIERLTAAVGFRYVYEADDDRYAHPAGLVVLTPGGRISRYLLGIDPPVRDLRLALVEASEGRIGTLSDRVLLLCYAWDPAAGRYGFAILTAVRIGGVLTVAALAAGITLLLRRERRRQTSRTSNIEHPALNLEPSGSRPSTLDSRPSP